MSRAVFVRAHGGPDVLQIGDRQVGDPGPGEVRIRQHAIGLNYIDVYYRTGLYKRPLPLVPGSEAAGEVVALGAGVTDFRVGDRVAYTGVLGAYADERLIPADRLVSIPDAISFETAAAIMLKGTTAWYLLFETWAIKPGDTILIHAAAGGVGLIAVQWAKALGARIIGTAGSPEKLAIARRHGCDEVINYRTENFAARVRELTGGRGVDVVYDGVGKDTFEASLDCLRPRGLMVSFGNASGPVSIPSLGILADKGSLYLTRPTSNAYLHEPAELRRAAGALFSAVASGIIKVSIGQTSNLADVGAAHHALEARQTSGSTVLLP